MVDLKKLYNLVIYEQKKNGLFISRPGNIICRLAYLIRFTSELSWSTPY